MLPYTEIINMFVPDTLFGIGAIDQIGKVVNKLGGSRPVLITDQGVVNAGLLDKIKAALTAEKLEFGVYDNCQPDAPLSMVAEAVSFVKDGKYDLIIAVGGGSSMDAAKVVAIAASEKRPLAEYVDAASYTRKGLPKIMVPTTAGTAAEWSTGAVLTNDLDKAHSFKKGVATPFFRAEAVIVDAGMTMDLPPAVTAQTGFDTLSHAIEPYTSQRANILSDMVCETCIRLVAQNLRAAYGQGAKNMGARYNMSIAASLGFGFSLSSGGAAHGMAYPLQMKAHIAHAESVAILLPHVMEFNMIADLPRHAKIAELMGEEVKGLSMREQAEWGVEAVRELITDLGMKTTMSSIGIKKEDIPGFVDIAFANSPGHFMNTCRIINRADMVRIYEAAL